MSVDSGSWKIRNEQKLTWKVVGTSIVYLNSKKKTSLKSEKKYKIRGNQNKYHHKVKGRKTLSSAVPGTRTWDLSFMKWVCYQLSYPSEWKTEKNNDNICIWFVVQQMYVSLIYPLNIVQHTLSHIVEHRKLDSLATPDNIVWSTVTSCWTNNVGQFDPSLMRQHKGTAAQDSLRILMCTCSYKFSTMRRPLCLTKKNLLK